MRVLAVGERCHVPLLSSAAEERIARLWDQAPLRCVLTFPAFAGVTPTCVRARHLLPGARFCNLLPPSPRPGLWDARLARHVAPLVHGWAAENACKVALLGRRVTAAFLGAEVPLGVTRGVEGVVYLTLPHPSGLSRLWNDEAGVERYRTMAREFCA